MTTELASEMMTTEEAHAAAEEIRNLTQSFARDLGRLRALALDFHGRKGWAALGYNTIEACAKNEFGWGRRQFYHQLTAGKIEESAGLPVGTTPERRIRPGVVKPQQDGNQVHNSLPAYSDERNNLGQAVEKIEQPETFPLEPLPDDPAEVERLKAETRRVVEEAWDAYEPEPDEDLHLDYSSMQERCRVEMPEPMVPFKILNAANVQVAALRERVTELEATNRRAAGTHAQIDGPLSDLGEIEAAVLKRHKISIGQAAGYFSQIVAAAELGGPSWEIRLKIATRPNPK